MAINLATKYSDKIASMYTVGSLVADKTSKEWDFSGVKSVKIYTPQTVEPTDYSRFGSSRYGMPTEMGDIVQELSMSQDKSFSLIIDKGNNTEQALVKNAGKMLKLQTNERMVPMVDKYALAKFAKYAGKSAYITKPTKSTIVGAIGDAAAHLDDGCVPGADRYVYLTGEMYNYLRQSSEFCGLENLGQKALAKGIVGEVFGMKIVKVPKSYMPEGVYFIVTHKNAVVVPYKIRDAKVHSDPPGISGALLEGRSNYDAFVVGARSVGVYAAADTKYEVKAPVIEKSSGNVTISATGDIYYTTDGSDPRYSTNAVKYSTEFAAGEECEIKAYCEKDGFLSEVAVG